MKEVDPIIARLHERLEVAADLKTKGWWEGYLRNVVTFRGVKMNDIRTIMHDWFHAERLSHWSVLEQKRLAIRLFEQGIHSEDKLAGVLLLRERLLPALDIEDIETLGSVFENEFIVDWNTCDWYCVKVLGNVVMKSRSPLQAAQRIARWTDARTLWQKRAAAVAFAAIAKRGDDNFAGFSDLLSGVCENNLRSSERFMQTSVGWVIRELSHAEPDRVASFVRRNVARMSLEAFKCATLKLPAPVKRELKLEHDRQRITEARPAPPKGRRPRQ